MTILNPPGRIAISPLFSGAPAQAARARRFVADFLDACAEPCARPGEGHPCRDDAVQLIGELIAESLRHAEVDGGDPGYTVSVQATPTWTRATLSTLTCGCWTSPELTPGRGVHLVGLFTSRWGVYTGRSGVAVWFELGHEALPGALGTDVAARSRPSARW